MDNWSEEFQKKNGRKPTFAEFQAHNAEQKSTATGAAPVQQSAESVNPNEAAAPQQTQAGQPSAPAQPGKPAEPGQPVQSAQNPTSGQAQQPAQGEEPTEVDKPAQGNQVDQPTQNVANTQPTQSLNPTVNMQSNYAGGPQQQQATPQNATMAQQNAFQSNQSPAPKKPSASGVKVKRFFRSPLGITATAVVILLVAFVATGLFTSTSRNGLRNKYNAAIKNNDTKALLALFPKEQTESRFADVGAKSFIDLHIPFDEFENASTKDSIRIVEKKHLLFFKSYSLSTPITKIDKGNTPKDGKLIIDGREMNDKDFKTAFFPGTYKVKLEINNQFGKSKFTTEFFAWKKTASIRFDLDNNYVTLPAGPDSIKVSYKGKETDVRLSDKEQKIGPFQKEDRTGWDPKKNIRLSGEYGGVEIEDAELYYMGLFGLKLSFEDKELLPFDAGDVKYDRKKFDPYIKSFASDWFKAGQNGSTKGLDTLDDLVDSTEVPSVFKNSKTKKYAYKGIEFDENSDHWLVFIGYDGKLYVYAYFNITYTETDSGSKGAKPVNKESSQQILFRVEKNGEMKAVANASYLDWATY